MIMTMLGDVMTWERVLGDGDMKLGNRRRLFGCTGS